MFVKRLVGRGRENVKYPCALGTARDAYYLRICGLMKTYVIYARVYIATCSSEESIRNVNDGFTRRGLFDLIDLIIRFVPDLRRVL